MTALTALATAAMKQVHPPSHATRATVREAVACLVLAVVYVLAGRVCLALDPSDGEATLAWPSAGVAFAATLVFGIHLWPGVALGAFTTSMWVGLPMSAALGASVAETVEVVLASLLLQNLRFSTMDRLRDVAALLVVCAGTTAIGATAGTAALFAGDAIYAHLLGATWRSWWLGDCAGAIVVTALVWTWTARIRPRPSSRGRAIEAVGIALFVAATFLIQFGAVDGEHVQLLKLPNLWFIVVAFAGARFAQRGTTLTILVIFAGSTMGVAFGAGPFVVETIGDSLVGLQAFMSVLAAAGLVLGAVVAERDAHAAELEAMNAGLKDALQARDTFLSVASHELRTPLSALQLQTELLTHSDDELPAGLGDRIQRVDRQVRRMKQLVDHLLDVSRITSGRLELEPERMDLAALVREIAARFDEEVMRTGGSLHVDVEGPIWGDWDLLRLDQVLSNLVSNAIKYGKGKPVEIEARIAGGAARVAVRDHGIGIAPEDHGRIFARFERLVPHRQGGGLGLGLWISDQLVTAMGGTIRVMSAPTLGSVFVVELPARSREARAEQPPGAASPGSAPGNAGGARGPASSGEPSDSGTSGPSGSPSSAA